MFLLLSCVCNEAYFYFTMHFLQFISRISFQMSHEIDGPKIFIGCTCMTFLQFELSLGQNTQLMERLRDLKRDTAQRLKHSCKRRKNEHRPISPPKKLAPKKRLFFSCFRVFSPVFRVLFPKISTGQKK